MAKPKNNYVPTKDDIKRLRTQASTRQPSAIIGPKSSTARKVDQSKLADPYKGAPKSQKAYNALNTAGRFAAETVALGAAGKAAKIAYKGSYLLGKKVVHGSPVQGLKTIKPNVSKKDDFNINAVWGMNTKGKGSGVNALAAARYAGDKGSVYLARVPRSSIIKATSNKAILASSKPAKVIKEIKVSGKPESQIFKEINRGLNKTGSRKLDKSHLSKQPKINKNKQPDF